MQALLIRLLIIAIATLAVIALFALLLQWHRDAVVAGAAVAGVLLAVVAVIDAAR